MSPVLPIRFAFALLFAVLAFPLRAQEAWSFPTPVTPQNLWSVAWGGNTFVATGEAGAIITSSDGLTWTPRFSGNSRWLVSVGYGDGQFVIVGDAGTILTSPDGIAWTGRTSGTNARINGVAFGGGRWLAVCESGEVLSSTDTLTWTKLAPSPDRLRGLTYAYGQFVITGDNGLMRTTVDTVDYDAKILPEKLFVESVVYARRMFVAVGEDGYAIRSDDAAIWNRVATGTTAYLRGVTFFNNTFIAVGSEGTILTSADPARTWTARRNGTALLTAAGASPEAVVAVGFNGTVLRSAPATAAPVIVAGPRNVAETAGSNVLLEVTATGSPPLTYQWFFQEQLLAGQTSDRLLLPNLQPANAGDYTAVVRNSLSTATSNPATVSLVTSTASGPIVDSSFAPSITFGTVAAVLEQTDGKLIIGGAQFFTTPGVSPFALVRLNVDGSLDTAFNSGAGLNSSSSVTTLALQPDGKILVGGSFSSFNGVARSNLLRLNADGSLDATYTTASVVTTSTPAQLSLQPDGRLLVLSGGKLYRLNADGQNDSSFVGPSYGFSLSKATLLPSGKILVGDSSHIRRINPSGTDDATFPSINESFVTAVALPDDRVLIERNEYSYGTTRDSIYRLNVVGTRDNNWPGISASSYQLSVRWAVTPDGKIIEAVNSADVSGKAIRSLRRYNPDASTDFSFDPRGGPNGDITTVVPLRNGQTIVVGNFTTFDSVSRPKLVRLVAANAPVIQPPVIVSVSPEAVAVRPGEPVTITMRAAGSAPLTYASSIGTPVVGTNDVTVSVPTTVAGAFNVTLTVSNRAGTVTSAPVRVVVAPGSPTIAQQPTPTTVRVGGVATFSVQPGGSPPFTYEWFRGPTRVGTSQTLTLTNVSAADASDYSVVVRNSLGTITSFIVHLTVDTSARLANISTRAGVTGGEQTLIAGFIISGTSTKDLLMRGVGPALASFNLSGLLPNPVITLYDSANRVIATNDNWNTTTIPAALFASVGAFGFANSSADAALRVSLGPGAYTLHVTESANRSGVALAEIYELDQSTGRIANLSSRAFVGTGASIAISGIVVQGRQPGRFLIRAIGPALNQFGVTGALADPTLDVTTAASVTVASNDNWSTNTDAAELAAVSGQVGAFPLAPGSRDAALLLTLAPGNYTALVSGAGSTTGVALIEVYEVP